MKSRTLAMSWGATVCAFAALLASAAAGTDDGALLAYLFAGALLFSASGRRGHAFSLAGGAAFAGLGALGALAFAVRGVVDDGIGFAAFVSGTGACLLLALAPRAGYPGGPPEKSDTGGPVVPTFPHACPGCRTAFGFREDDRGTRRLCPRCGTAFRVPRPPAKAALLALGAQIAVAFVCGALGLALLGGSPAGSRVAGLCVFGALVATADFLLPYFRE